MNLHDITRRLNLYPDYLRYFIDFLPTTKMVIDFSHFHHLSPEYVMRVYEETGCLFCNDHPEIKPVTFDKWLINNGHGDLAINTDPIMVNFEGQKFIQQKWDGFTYHFMHIPEFDN